MMKRQLLRRRSYIIIAALAITFLAGTLTSTASAKFRGADVQGKNFSVTYVGVTPPVDSMPNGISDLVLKQVDGRFVGKRRSQMTVRMLRNGFIGTRLMNTMPCNEAGDATGWCIDQGRQTWVAMPQMVHSMLRMEDTDAMFGPAFIMQIIDGDGYDGFATYRVTVENPTDTLTQGAVVTINIDGSLSKMKTKKQRGHDDDDDDD